MKTIKDLNMVHPILVKCHHKIQREIIDRHNMPIRLFETGRDHVRHQKLISKGRTKEIVSRHLYNLQSDPPQYATALDYVFYDKRWSWNFRDCTVKSWYMLFGNLVLDLCSEIEWAGLKRKGANYTHFSLKSAIIIDNMSHYPCVII